VTAAVAPSIFRDGCDGGVTQNPENPVYRRRPDTTRMTARSVLQCSFKRNVI
jgi:hypothetical protein